MRQKKRHLAAILFVETALAARSVNPDPGDALIVDQRRSAEQVKDVVHPTEVVKFEANQLGFGDQLLTKHDSRNGLLDSTLEPLVHIVEVFDIGPANCGIVILRDPEDGGHI